MSRSSRRILVAFLALGAGACRFDPGGLGSGPGGDDDDDDDATIDAAAPAIDAPPDAPPPDAAPCVDEDGDLVPRVNVEGAECGAILDCDDADEDAFPGQPGFFDHQRTSGGYDFDCDEVEEPFNETQGEDCHFDWFTCVGSGWVDSVPGCGLTGTWHICVDGGLGVGCVESDRFDAAQSCQ